MANELWGIDLGGTKIEGVIMPSTGDINPILRMRVNTEAEKGYAHILRQIKSLVEELQTSSSIKPEAIGFGTPGTLEPASGLMKNCNTTCLNGKALKHDLEQLLNVPIEIANDANCFALAETHWGVVKESYPGAKVVFGIIMGTGVGAGIVINGKVWNGTHGIAGEWGHNFLDESGGKCYCGKVGCVETVISGPALEKYFYQLCGDRKPLAVISKLALAKHTAAVQTMDRLHTYFGKAVATVINILDPDVIVVGGGVGNIDTIYSEGTKALEHYIFNNGVNVPILKPVLGDSAGVFGAAALVSNN